MGISAFSTTDPANLAREFTKLGMQAIAVYGSTITGFLPLASIVAMDSLDSLEFARPVLKPIANVGLTTSAGDVAQRTALVRSFYDDPSNTNDLTGAGVRLGVISDSYDNNGAGPGSAAADIASGDLPGAGNPNGWTNPVTVLRDNVVGIDEGRAMLQIAHDVAPGAELVFANVADLAGMQSPQAFADNIRLMRDVGNVDIIVDDIAFPNEPFFMDGAVAQAVDDVVADGVTYISAAGNSSNDSYESSFRSSGVTENFTSGGITRSELLHDFDPGPAIDTRQRVTIPPGTTRFSFQWDDPFRTVAPASTGATRDFDIYLLTTSGTTISAGVLSTIGQDPVEVVGVNNTNPFFVGIDIVIALRNGANPGGFLKYVAFNSDAVITEFATNSPTSFGHANAVGAIAVGATAYYNTPEFGPAAPYAPPALNNFSALGGTNILFDTAGNRLVQPEIRNGVNVIGPDGGNTTFFGTDVIQDADALPNFFGTSAAAPHIAGLAALLLQLDPLLGPAGIENALELSAIDMDNPYTPGFDVGEDAATGAGFVDALGAIGIVQDTLQLVGLDPNEYILVNVTNDALDTNLDPNIIDVSPAAGNQVSLRSAVINANLVTSTQKTILVPNGNYNLTLASATENSGTNDLDITGNVTIVGAGPGATVIDASSLDAGVNSRIFDVRSGATLNLSRATVTGGSVLTDSGGAFLVLSGAALNLDQVSVVGNRAANGGAIRLSNNGSALSITRSVFTDNTATASGGALAATNQVNIAIGSTIFAHDTAPVNPNLGLAGTGSLTNNGLNRIDNVSGAGAFFNQSAPFNDFIGPVDYVVTAVADTFNHANDAYALSLREAIDLANADVPVNEIWLPAWVFVLTRERLIMPDGIDGSNATDIDVAWGDLDIRESLIVRGVNGQSTVKWRTGIVDAVFDLLGDYNGDGIANGVDNGSVGTEDYTIWRNTLGSTTNLIADGNDNGIVDQNDWNIWNSHYGNTLVTDGVVL